MFVADWIPRPAGEMTPLPADDAYAPKVLTLNNYWGLRQDFKHPWKGTPRYDGFDGNSDGTYAVFADPRFAARAIAIALADWQAEGVVTATDIAARLNAADPSLAQAMVDGSVRVERDADGLSVHGDSQL